MITVKKVDDVNFLVCCDVQGARVLSVNDLDDELRRTESDIKSIETHLALEREEFTRLREIKGKIDGGDFSIVE